MNNDSPKTPTAEKVSRGVLRKELSALATSDLLEVVLAAAPMKKALVDFLISLDSLELETIMEGVLKWDIRVVEKPRKARPLISDDGQWFTTLATSRALGMHSNTLRRIADKGDIPSYRIGEEGKGRRKFRKEDIEEYLERRKQ